MNQTGGARSVASRKRDIMQISYKLSLKVVFYYLLFGVVWIVFSDYLINRLFQTAPAIAAAQTWKGLAFVLITAVLLFFLTKKHFRALNEANVKLRRAYVQTVSAITRAGEKADPYTYGHEVRVAQLACAAAERLGWSMDRIEGLRLGAYVHDIGKITIPSEILNKPGQLTEAEFRLIKTHPALSYEMLCNIPFPWPIAEIAYQHHERIDGSGYPRGLKGDQICEEAKLLGVADVIEAMCSHRPYRPGLGLEAALAEVRDGAGSRYDTSYVEACAAVVEAPDFQWLDAEELSAAVLQLPTHAQSQGLATRSGVDSERVA